MSEVKCRECGQALPPVREADAVPLCDEACEEAFAAPPRADVAEPFIVWGGVVWGQSGTGLLPLPLVFLTEGPLDMSHPMCPRIGYVVTPLRPPAQPGERGVKGPEARQ